MIKEEINKDLKMKRLNEDEIKNLKEWINEGTIVIFKHN